MTDEDTGIINITLEDVKELKESGFYFWRDLPAIDACLMGGLPTHNQQIQFAVHRYREYIKNLKPKAKLSVIERLRLIIWRFLNV